MGAKSKNNFAARKKNSPDRGGRRTRGGQWRGKGRQAPQEFGIRQSVLNASLPVVNARVRRIELASRDRRTLVGVRRWRHGAAGKFSPGFRRFSAEFRRFSPPNGALNDENPVWQTKFREFARRSVAKSEPRAPKSGPEAPKEGPRACQGGQVGGQEGPREAPGGFPRRPGETSETILAFRRPKKSSFESHLWRDSLEKRVRSGVLRIFEACAQTRKCKKPVKTYGFPRFFVGRVFFAKVRAGASKDMKIH